MKVRLLTLTIVILLLLPSLVFALDSLYPAEIERVIDGDTIVVDLCLGLNVILDGQYIRFYGIDAWEIRGEEREKGLKAKEYLEGRLDEAERVEIEIRPEWSKNKTGKDSFGRWLGIIYIHGVNINDELMEKGHAEKYEGGLDGTERNTRMNNLWEGLRAGWPFYAAFGTLIAIMLTALASFRGVQATRDAAEATRKTAEGQLFMQIRTAYSSEKMLWGMRELIRFEKEYGKNYAKVFGEKLRNNYPQVMEWDAARRRFAHWRSAVQMLWEHKFISKNLFDNLWKENQQEFYEEYIQPLESEVKRDMEERKKKRKDATNEKTDEKTR